MNTTKSQNDIFFNFHFSQIWFILIWDDHLCITAFHTPGNSFRMKLVWILITTLTLICLSNNGGKLLDGMRG